MEIKECHGNTELFGSDNIYEYIIYDGQNGREIGNYFESNFLDRFFGTKRYKTFYLFYDENKKCLKMCFPEESNISKKIEIIEMPVPDETCFIFYKRPSSTYKKYYAFVYIMDKKSFYRNFIDIHEDYEDE